MSEKTLDALAGARNRVVGQKQVLAALENHEAAVVFLAENADGQIRKLILRAAMEEDAEVVSVATMEELGSGAGIRVEATCAAIIRKGDELPEGL